MRRQVLVYTMMFKVTVEQRSAVERLAESSECSVSEASRRVLDAGIKAMGLC